MSKPWTEIPTEAKEIARKLIKNPSALFTTLYYEEANLIIANCLHLGAEVHARKTPTGVIEIRVPQEEGES